MSRSQPNEGNPHPCKRFYEWNGEKGVLRHFDKTLGDKGENIETPAKGFEFVLLDRLATVKGWNDASESGIYSNEVKDTRYSPLTVKAFKQREPIATGLYSEIKDEVKAAGGRFVTMLYIAFPDPETKGVMLGSIALKGAALRQWMEFENENRDKVYSGGIRISDVKEGMKGKVAFKMPVFELTECDVDLDKTAKELDKQLQAYLDSYLKRPVQESPQKDEDGEDIPF